MCQIEGCDNEGYSLVACNFYPVIICDDCHLMMHILDSERSFSETVRKDSDAVAALAKKTALERFERGWVDSKTDTLSGKFYGCYEFYQNDIDIIKADLESSPTKTLKQVADLVRLEPDFGAQHDKWPRMTKKSNGRYINRAAVLAILTTSTDETDGKGGTDA